MPQLKIEQTFRLAVEHHQAGRLPEAETLYRQILAVEPTHSDCLHLLGVLAGQGGCTDLALDLMRKAISASPENPVYHYNLGNILQKAGQLDQAAASLQQAVTLNPNYAQAHDNLGVIYQLQGKLQEAIASHKLAIDLKPQLVNAHNNLANAMWQAGHLDQAIDGFQQLLALKPDHAEAYINLGNVWKDKGELDNAIACYGKALALRPDYPQIEYNLACALRDKGQSDAAITHYQRAITLDPNCIEAHVNLGNVWKDKKQLDNAIACYERALTLRPDATPHNNLGIIWYEKGQLDNAIAAFHRALAADPEYYEAHYNLGNAYKDKGQLDQAAASYQRALAINPDSAEAFNNLGNAWSDKGQIDQAIGCYERAMALRPTLVSAHDCYVFYMHYHPAYDSHRILAENRRWNDRHARPLQSRIQPHTNDRNPDRRLRIGYVSPDFREHPVGRFLLPLLASHDHNSFEILCYAQVAVPDEMTVKLQGYADIWRNTVGLSDEQMAEMVRQDQIDDFDLTPTGHTLNNRLLVFARKPCWKKITYPCVLQYETGALTQPDYRYFTESSYLNHPDQNDDCYSEQSIRLPETYWCYQPPIELDESKATSGSITFGCLNNFSKVAPTTLEVWCELLKVVPDSQLILHARDGAHRQQILDVLASQGIDPTRLCFVGFISLTKYFELYRQIDVCLDPFPFAGGTTTCDALWMGVLAVS